MAGLFGTDGVRGVVNLDLTAELALALGRAAAGVIPGCTGGRVVVGRDTRASGPMLEAALAAGLAAGGANVELLGVLTTPAIAYLGRLTAAQAAVVISASHNPFEYNGIKFFDGSGFKLSEAVELAISEAVADVAAAGCPAPPSGMVTRRTDGEARYLDYLAGLSIRTGAAPRLVIDCAHGAASQLAPALMDRLGLAATVINASPDGTNINDGAGSMYPEALAARVVATGADLGLALDGDADRVLAVDERGRLVDGDHMLAICGLELLARNRLDQQLVVGTVMSNMGLDVCLRKAGARLVRTPVGDRHVHAEMLRRGAVLGGEQSGHIIFSRHATTGDGLLTAIQLLNVMSATELPLSELRDQMKVMPQVLLNVPVIDGRSWDRHPDIVKELERVQTRLDGRGRVLVRSSGTEPVVRVMVEGEDLTLVEPLADGLAAVIQQKLGGGRCRG